MRHVAVGADVHPVGLGNRAGNVLGMLVTEFVGNLVEAVGKGAYRDVVIVSVGYAPVPSGTSVVFRRYFVGRPFEICGFCLLDDGFRISERIANERPVFRRVFDFGSGAVLTVWNIGIEFGPCHSFQIGRTRKFRNFDAYRIGCGNLDDALREGVVSGFRVGYLGVANAYRRSGDRKLYWHDLFERGSRGFGISRR